MPLDYGFVCFKEAVDAAKALEVMQKVVIDNKVLMVSYFVSKKANELPQGSRNMDPITQNLAVAFNSNVCVKYIPFGVSEEHLKKVFNF